MVEITWLDDDWFRARATDEVRTLSGCTTVQATSVLGIQTGWRFRRFRTPEATWTLRSRFAVLAAAILHLTARNYGIWVEKNKCKNLQQSVSGQPQPRQYPLDINIPGQYPEQYPLDNISLDNIPLENWTPQYPPVPYSSLPLNFWIILNFDLLFSIVFGGYCPGAIVQEDIVRGIAQGVLLRDIVWGYCPRTIMILNLSQWAVAAICATTVDCLCLLIPDLLGS